MPENAVKQTQDMVRFREHSTTDMKERFMGMVQTVWSGTGQFLDSFYGRKAEDNENTPVACFKALFDEIDKLSDPK
jgi:hypothetical protein